MTAQTQAILTYFSCLLFVLLSFGVAAASLNQAFGDHQCWTMEHLSDPIDEVWTNRANKKTANRSRDAEGRLPYDGHSVCKEFKYQRQI